MELPYQVKFKHNDEYVYGITSEYCDESKKLIPQGKVIVKDAITPETYIVNISDLMEIPMSYTHFGEDAYHVWVENSFKLAQSFSDGLEEFGPGFLFSIGVGDGSAWYVVTKVSPRTVTIEWRGFCLDRWLAPMLGYGGKFPRKMIEPYFAHNKAYEKIFGRKTDK